MSSPEKLILKRKKTTKADIEDWRKYWHDAGPVRFAQEYLFCPPQVPPYPNWQEHQVEAYCEGCKCIHKKFHDDGVPVHVILSEEQIYLLEDVWLRGIRLVLVSAGRGAGKTFILAVWNTWRMCTEDYYEITCMGGSAPQSKIIQKYVDYWRLKHYEVGYIINRSPKAIGNRGCITRMGSETKFIACSPTAAMGPHVNEVQVDEACAAEAKGVEGQEAIEAIDWQVTGRRDTVVWMTSTSHYLLGQFYKIYRNPKKFGFKRYIWSIAKHISGKSPALMYGDKDPKHWKPAVWWVTQEDIEKLRKRKSNEEWLCWALGRASLASGALFRPKDLDIIICPLCDEDDCQPYKWGHCKLIEKYGLGDQANPLRNIRDIKGGFDYGDPAPCALIIGGIKGKFIFILYAFEQKGLTSAELMDWIERELIRFKVTIMNIPDSIAGKHVREILDDKGYAIYELDESNKEERVGNIKNIVEKHAIIVPPAFWHLCESLKGMHRDKQGRIVKHNDHSFDGLCYLCIEWGDMEGSISNFFEVMEEILSAKGVMTKIEDEEKEDDDDFYFKGIRL